MTENTVEKDVKPPTQKNINGSRLVTVSYMDIYSDVNPENYSNTGKMVLLSAWTRSKDTGTHKLFQILFFGKK